MQQLGCESHSVTCVSCYVHVYGNKVIIIINILALTRHSWTSGLDIGLVGPVARGASRFENLLAPQKTYWPGGPVDLKTYWPPKKLTGPPKN